MDKFVVPLSKEKQSKPMIIRERWERSRVELDGRLGAKYRHRLSGLFMHSYSQIGAFSLLYLVGEQQYSDHAIHLGFNTMANPYADLRGGISALEFDRKGIYLALVTKAGYLTVLDFETLYSQVNLECLSGLKKDERMHLLHIPRHEEIDIVKWNLANQDEVACTSMNSKNLLIFDIGYISSDPVEVLSKRRNFSGFNVEKGFSDIAFSSSSDSRVFASDSRGVINLWDRRRSKLPCLEFSTDSNNILNSIEVVEENQVIFGACKSGIIHIWDLRGGRSSTAFQSQKEACYSPLASLKLATALEKVGSLKAQANIVPKEIHSIDINPSCPNQLAFHLDDGWSGVLDIHNFRVTHVHCPPPPWLEGENDFTNISYLRKPSWVSRYSMYAVGSAHSKGLYLLDFYSDLSSPCHIDYNEDTEGCPTKKQQSQKNRFVPLSDNVVACAAHPLNGTIVAGTKDSSVIVISQKHHPMKVDEFNVNTNLVGLQNLSPILVDQYSNSKTRNDSEMRTEYNCII